VYKIRSQKIFVRFWP